MLKKYWSPEQIYGHLKKENQISVSATTIDRSINADKSNNGNFYMNLRRHGRKRRKPYGDGKKGAEIQNRVDISMRSEEINQRARTGNGEGIRLSERNIKVALLLWMSINPNLDWISL